MACESGPAFEKYWRRFDFMEAIACEYTAQLPLTAVALIVFGAVAMVAYVRTGSIVIPAGYVFLTGGVVLPLIAPVGLAFAGLFVLLVGGGVMAFLYWRFSP